MSPWRSKAWARLQPGLVSPAGPPAANCLRDFIFWRSQRCPCQLARRRALTWKSWTWEEKSQRCLSPEQSLRSPNGPTFCTFARTLFKLQKVGPFGLRSEEHTSELQSPDHLVCCLLLDTKKRDHMIN